jgi:hypothetical protein
LSPPIPAISLHFVFRKWLCEHDAQRVLLPENIHLQCSMNDTSVHYLAL